MQNPLASRELYEEYIYTIVERHVGISRSTLTLVPRSATVAHASGKVELASGLEVRVRETIDFEDARILDYSYEIRRGERILSWFDSQPHPDDPSLIESFPHHQHIPPDIKRHRIPAADLSFDRPNLDYLVELLAKWL